MRILGNHINGGSLWSLLLLLQRVPKVFLFLDHGGVGECLCSFHSVIVGMGRPLSWAAFVSSRDTQTGYVPHTLHLRTYVSSYLVLG